MSKLTFRRIALDRLSSADDLDRALRVTSMRTWILLTALCIVMTSIVTWGTVAAVPLTVAGKGIMLKSGGIFSIVSTVSGRVADVSVGVGDMVREGQVVARVAQPDLVEQLQLARMKLSNMEQGHAALLGARNHELTITLESLRQQTVNLTRAVAADEQLLEYFQEKVTSQQQLVSEGRLIRQTLINTIRERDTVTARIRERRTEMTDVELRTQQAKSQRDEAVRSSAFAMKETASEVAQLERGLTAGAEVRSPYTGRIIEIAVEQGGIVSRADSLFTLDLAGRTVTALEALVYVPAEDGKRISAGMDVQISPATVRREEHGYLLGKVTYISDLPATSRGMLRTLKDEDLVRSLTGGNPPHEVHVDLMPDLTTESGYRWSSGRGPSMKIGSGTLCESAIVVETRQPIQMVVPFLRKAVGG